MKRKMLLAAVPVLVLAAGCGGDDSADTSADGDDLRTVEITMDDIAYEPTTLQVEAGETIRFVFTNSGVVDHDAFVGDTAAQVDHEADMREADDDGHAGHGDDGDALTVEPGKTGTLTYTFDEPGEIEIGCHQPGHYKAGMKVDVTVT